MKSSAMRCIAVLQLKIIVIAILLQHIIEESQVRVAAVRGGERVQGRRDKKTIALGLERKKR